jgi:holliday junction DNA helicase RuvA
LGMIAYLRGTLLIRDDPYIVIEAHGVGYKVFLPSSVLSKLPEISNEFQLFTYTHVREDILELYGFEKYKDLKLFEMLISVSGVGPKTAIGVFSIGSSADIKNAIVNGDVAFFTSVPRLGKKNAQKLIIELKNKFGAGSADLVLDDLAGEDSIELIAALKVFGYSSQEAHRALQEVDSQGGSLEEKVKRALKYLGR